jgi:hypothetical protein
METVTTTVWVTAAGLLLTGTALLVVPGRLADWDCRTGGSQGLLDPGAGLLTACGLLLLLWTQKYGWLLARSEVCSFSCLWLQSTCCPRSANARASAAQSIPSPVRGRADLPSRA